MSINNRLISTDAVSAACTTDTLQILGDTSCIHYYRMEDVNDMAGTNYGTATNVDFNATGKFGNAGSFNGSSSQMNLGDNDNFSPSVNALSVSCWIKTTGTVDFIFSKGGSGAYEYGLFIDGSGQIGLQAYTLSASSSVSINTSSAYNDGNWHHVVGVYDPSGNFKIYVDGSQQATSSSSLSMGNSSNALILGKKYDTSSDFYDGLLDQVRIFNKAVSASEVSTLYAEVQCTDSIKPDQHFNTVTYTGNGSTQSITGVGFQPDLVWIKSRNAAASHAIFDSIRGVNEILQSNDSAAEVDLSPHGLTNFNSDGFSVSDVAGGNNAVNGSAGGSFSGTPPNYVSWNWYCPTSFSHSGSGTLLASSGKSNQDAGISIVKFDYPTGNSSTVRTVKHNLSTAPDFILYKPYIMTASGNSNWFVYHKSMGDSAEMYLNLAIGKATDANRWNATAPTGGANGVVTLGTSFSQYADNFYGGTTLMYCMHDVAGYQKFGTYAGNTSTPPSITLGFSPSFLMIVKDAGSASPFVLIDSDRAPNNPASCRLRLNATDAEYCAATEAITRSATGFTVNSNWDGTNDNGTNYIYWAIA